MKITVKNSVNNGPANKHSKSTKKSKVPKKIPEKIQKEPSSSHLQEVLAKESSAKRMVKKTHENEQVCPQRLPNIVNKTQLEKRKQDAGEWKPLKKVDYQRLETVMEEGQLSSEETSSKHNFLKSGKSESGSDSGSDTDNAVADVAPVKSRKSWIYSLMSLADHTESLKTGEDPLKKPLKHEQLHHKPSQLQKQQPEKLTEAHASEKGSVIELGESHGEPTESLTKECAQSKRSVILSGMMEILPIFSNDKFVCSRDAISIEEWEDPELDRSGTGSGKMLLEAKSVKDSRTIDIKPFISANCMKKEGGVDGRFVEKMGDFHHREREATERKQRFKVLTDRNVCQQTSSPFINSLLVLTSFSNEKGRLLNEQKVKESVDGGKISTPRHFAADLEEGKCLLSWKVCFCLAMTALCLLTIFLVSFAWKSYQPPCFMDSVMEALPFIRPRRSYLQHFLDKFVRLLLSCIGSMNLSFSLSNRISELAVK